jgi:hypothetical protein
LSLMRLTTRMRQKHDMTTTDMHKLYANDINREPQQFVTHVRTYKTSSLRGTSGIYSPTFMSTSYFSRARLLPYTCIFLAHSSGPHKCIILARGSSGHATLMCVRHARTRRAASTWFARDKQYLQSYFHEHKLFFSCTLPTLHVYIPWDCTKSVVHTFLYNRGSHAAMGGDRVCHSCVSQQE